MHQMIRTSSIESLGVYLLARNEKPGHILRSIGLSPCALLDRDAWLDRDQALALENDLANIMCDPLLGFHIAQQFSLVQYEESSTHLLNQSTLGDALRYAAQIIPSIESGTRLSLRRKGRMACLTSEMLGDFKHDPRHQLDGHSLVLRKLLQLAGEPMDVFARLPRDSTMSEEIECLLEAKVEFNADSLELLFPWDALEAPLLMARAPVATASDSHKVCLRVMRTISETMKTGRPTAEKTAETLGTNLRAMQRHLAGWGVTFELLLDNYRRDSSRKLLAAGRYSITEIAHRLAYSDSAHFTRAFRRWYGVPPNQFRAQISVNPSSWGNELMVG